MRQLVVILVLFSAFVSFSQEEEIVLFPDVDAAYPGNNAEMQKFIIDSIRYPSEIDPELGTRVFVSFIVEKDGSLTDVRIVRSAQKSLDEEVIRLIKSMPNWQPGEVNGKAVRSRVQLPVSFEFFE